MISIGSKTIAQGARPFIIAEVAQAHDGSLGMAHAYIDLAARVGADAVKFQTHIAAAESTQDEQFRIKFSKQDETRYDYWRRMEFTAEQWAGLAAHAADKNIVFLSSAFSIDAVELLKKIGMPAWKIGSGEFRSTEMMQVMAATGAPILLSTGMSHYDEIARGVSWFRAHNTPFALFQCTSKYPTPLEEVGLNVIDRLHNDHNCPVGLSDHTGTVFPSLAAMARGAAMIEVHITFDRGMFGPDVPASLIPAEMELLCRARDAFSIMDANPVDKDDMAAKMKTMRGLFTKSIAPVRDLPSGTTLTADMLVPRKPGTGIPYSEKDRLVGKCLRQDVRADRIIKWDDIENADDIRKTIGV